MRAELEAEGAVFGGAVTPEFIARVYQYHRSSAREEMTTDAIELARHGVHLVPSDLVPDDQLAERLWEVIHALARLRIYLEFTDHLDDRSLYRALVEDVLKRPRPLEPEDAESSTHIQMTGEGDEGYDLYLKHYANEAERAELAAMGFCVPMMRALVADRDRLLPRAWST